MNRARLRKNLKELVAIINDIDDQFTEEWKKGGRAMTNGLPVLPMGEGLLALSHAARVTEDLRSYDFKFLIASLSD